MKNPMQQKKIGNYKVDSEGKPQDNWCATAWREPNHIEWGGKGGGEGFYSREKERDWLIT